MLVKIQVCIIAMCGIFAGMALGHFIYEPATITAWSYTAVISNGFAVCLGVVNIFNSSREAC